MVNNTFQNQFLSLRTGINISFKIINKIAPIIAIDSYNTNPTNQNIVVTASTNGGTLNSDSHTFTENGAFDFVATDLAGNSKTETVTITNIDKVIPNATVSYSTTDWTNQSVTATINPSETCN